MVIYTDNIDFARCYIPEVNTWQAMSLVKVDKSIEQLAEKLAIGKIFYTTSVNNDDWSHLFIVEYSPDSQFDVLIELAQEKIQLPDRILCLAGSGGKFHGFRNRPWLSVEGNIHLSAFIAPESLSAKYAIGFTMLSALSVVETIDSIEGLSGKSSIKWVNDILIGSSKVAGVLAHTQSQGDRITAAVLGIGFNIETSPEVKPTPFVANAAALKDFQSDENLCNQRLALEVLINSLHRNYEKLAQGSYSELLAKYRQRSIVLQRNVTVCSDEPDGTTEIIVSGKVIKIGENLELYLEGINTPITKGRLVL
jgi:biotin-[acetyl-CoA-carboxylase] ligase BirA-like protein